MQKTDKPKQNKLRNGFTTGSCAAAAAKAAAKMLLGGGRVERVSIVTPKGDVFDAVIEDIRICGDRVKCAVRKDGGDDPDITTGTLIYSEVAYSDEPGITIKGGEGVGRVTRPGLDQPVGEAAINSVPRRMITDAVSETADLYGCGEGLTVTVSVPEGEKLAERTFNPKLGIEGGISIIGTSGVVEPMSEQALLDTIKVELSQKKAEGCSDVFISPGNYGLDFMRETYGVDLDRSVKCSNFIGRTADMICGMGFEGMLLTGHAGKLVKVAGGIMNTHSNEADCRMEIIACAAAKEGADTETIKAVLGCLTTEEAFSILKEGGLLRSVSERIMDGILKSLDRRADGRLHIECIMYTKEKGLLAASAGADKMIDENRRQWNL